MIRSLRSSVYTVKRPVLLFGWAVALTVLFPKIAPDWVFYLFSGVFEFHHAIGESIRREGVAVVIAGLGYLKEVRTAIENEKQILVTERDAFEQFAVIVESMEVTTSTMPTGLAIRTEKLADSTQLKRIQDHYRETVMSVPHYDEDYGEDLFEHMSEELSPEAAIAVGGESEFAPQLK